MNPLAVCLPLRAVKKARNASRPRNCDTVPKRTTQSSVNPLTSASMLCGAVHAMQGETGPLVNVFANC
jgi:hypothetical protein